MDKFEPPSPPPFRSEVPPVKLVATDMDGTLTRRGRFTADLLEGLDRLNQANLSVVVITGRSAGWVQGLAHYLPIAGAIAENGGLYVPGANAEAELLVDLPNGSAHRQQLSAMFDTLRQQCLDLTPSSDNPFRLTDWTFDVAGLTQAQLDQLKQTCQAAGWGFTYSTVQCHIYPAGQSKAAGLQRVLNQHFPALTAQEVLTVGDSPNDESLFDRDLFPHGVGVANLKDYWDRLTHHPTAVTAAPEVDGFLELVEVLVSKGQGRC